MSIQWTLIATFLYVEIGVVLLLLMPFLSAQRWQKIFRSRFLNSLSNQATMYFYVLLSILVLFFLDAIREMRKYSSEHEEVHQHLNAEMQVHMKLFRAQRNFYISGFALFLSMVIRRLVTLISMQASFQAQSEASMKQAASASEAAKRMMSQNRSGESAQNDTNEAHDKEVTRLKAKLSEVEDALRREKKNVESMKAQAESVSAEYDRLMEEHRSLQQKVENSGNKKDE